MKQTSHRKTNKLWLGYRVVKIIETEQNDGCQEPEEGGNGESDEYRVSVWED